MVEKPGLRISIQTPNALSVFFMNSQVGWRVGTQGSIQKTTNAGKSWASQSKSFTRDEFIQVDFTR